MISAYDVNKTQTKNRIEKERQAIEYESKYTYYEDGQKLYYNASTPEDIDYLIQQTISRSDEVGYVYCYNRLNPDTVNILKEHGYHVFLNTFTTQDFVATDSGKRYKTVYYTNRYTYIVWSSIPKVLGTLVEL